MKALEKKYIDKIDQHLITSLGKFEYGYVMYAETAKTFISELCEELESLQTPKTCEDCVLYEDGVYIPSRLKKDGNCLMLCINVYKNFSCSQFAPKDKR